MYLIQMKVSKVCTVVTIKSLICTVVGERWILKININDLKLIEKK